MGMTRRLKVMLYETIATTSFRTTTLKLFFLPFDNNVATMFRRCVTLIIVVVKRPCNMAMLNAVVVVSLIACVAGVRKGRGRELRA